MVVKILRQDNPFSEPYWQSFNYDGDKNASIAAVIDYINYRDDMFDINGEPAGRISWESSCLQGMCGACAMVINGMPRLACETFVKDLKGDTITVEPLKKFPVISDLVVDRGIIQENLKQANAFIGEYSRDKEKDHDLQYLIGRCLKCGMCLEACPNYVKGENFYGPLFANDSFFIASRSTDNKSGIKSMYEEHFAKGCSKSLACEKVCPVKIPTLASMAKMNRFKV
jgi:succinate dehydrogenase and fumarate reductase iron-sulfur protein